MNTLWIEQLHVCVVHPVTDPIDWQANINVPVGSKVIRIDARGSLEALMIGNRSLRETRQMQIRTFTPVCVIEDDWQYVSTYDDEDFGPRHVFARFARGG